MSYSGRAGIQEWSDGEEDERGRQRQHNEQQANPIYLRGMAIMQEVERAQRERLGAGWIQQGDRFNVPERKQIRDIPRCKGGGGDPRQVNMAKQRPSAKSFQPSSFQQRAVNGVEAVANERPNRPNASQA